MHYVYQGAPGIYYKTNSQTDFILAVYRMSEGCAPTSDNKQQKKVDDELAGKIASAFMRPSYLQLA